MTRLAFARGNSQVFQGLGQSFRTQKAGKTRRARSHSHVPRPSGHKPPTPPMGANTMTDNAFDDGPNLRADRQNQLDDAYQPPDNQLAEWDYRYDGGTRPPFPHIPDQAHVAYTKSNLGEGD